MITIPVIAERCGAIDVGKRGLAAAVAVGPADKKLRSRLDGSGPQFHPCRN
jgi:hypothetical protein